ncbi:extensin-like [Vigna unguiculata]|uniref:extensin-like n=1 Tax=Vigna unguiculata TaxID=3917 RepID=UPI00101606BC|nr:extensin-like [Vigna unguiculata]
MESRYDTFQEAIDSLQTQVSALSLPPTTSPFPPSIVQLAPSSSPPSTSSSPVTSPFPIPPNPLYGMPYPLTVTNLLPPTHSSASVTLPPQPNTSFPFSSPQPYPSSHIPFQPPLNHHNTIPFTHLHHNTPPPTPTSPLRPPKLQLNLFYGFESLDWLFEAEQYFSLYQVPPEHRIYMCSFYMKGDAWSCYKWMYHNSQFST